VAIFPSLEGEDLVDFTNRLFERWRLGQKGLDNGVLLAVYLEDRKARIEVGYGLEGRLTDALSRRILEQELIPRFREKDYAQGIRSACAAIVAATRGEYTAKAKGGRSSRRGTPLAFLIGLAMIIGLALLRGLAGLESGITYDSRGRRVRRGAGWIGGLGGLGGGSRGGLFGGGGGFGGFSGGGGMSGGGGASGSW